MLRIGAIFQMQKMSVENHHRFFFSIRVLNDIHRVADSNFSLNIKKNMPPGKIDRLIPSMVDRSSRS